MRHNGPIAWRAAGCAIALLMVGACIPLGHGSTYSRQTVVAKTTDGYLVAAGGDKCRALTPALAAAEIGTSVRCVWLSEAMQAQIGRPARRGLALPLPPIVGGH